MENAILRLTDCELWYYSDSNDDIYQRVWDCVSAEFLFQCELQIQVKLCWFRNFGDTKPLSDGFYYIHILHTYRHTSMGNTHRTQAQTSSKYIDTHGKIEQIKLSSFHVFWFWNWKKKFKITKTKTFFFALTKHYVLNAISIPKSNHKLRCSRGKFALNKYIQLVNHSNF